MWPCRRGETRTCAVRDPWRDERRRRRRKRNEEEEKGDTPKQEEVEEEREEERECTACPHNPAGEREENKDLRPRTKPQGLILDSLI